MTPSGLAYLVAQGLSGHLIENLIQTFDLFICLKTFMAFGYFSVSVWSVHGVEKFKF